MGVIQILAFGLGITALLMVTVMRTQLMEGWINSLPSDTPNRFLMNIQPDQRASLMKFFAEENLTTPATTAPQVIEKEVIVERVVEVPPAAPAFVTIGVARNGQRQEYTVETIAPAEE